MPRADNIGDVLVVGELPDRASLAIGSMTALVDAALTHGTRPMRALVVPGDKLAVDPEHAHSVPSQDTTRRSPSSTRHRGTRDTTAACPHSVIRFRSEAADFSRPYANRGRVSIYLLD